MGRPVTGVAPPGGGRSRRSAGFTLIELMIALTLVGLMVGLLFGGIRFADRTWERVDEVAARTSERRQVWRFLESRLQQARLVFEPVEEGARGERYALFYGTGEALEFVTPFPEVGFGGLNLVRIEAVGSGDERQLLLSRWLLHPDVLEGGDGIPQWGPLRRGHGTPAGPADEAVRAFFSQTVLVEGLKGFSIDYFGAVDNEEEPAWRDDWESARMPERVALGIEDADGEWPEMAFPLPLDEAGARRLRTGVPSFDPYPGARPARTTDPSRKDDK